MKRAPRVVSRSRHARHHGLNVSMPGDMPKVNIMRPGPWGNPYSIGTHGNRAEVLDLYAAWLPNQYELLNERWRLRGADLECCCAPLRCHGDLLLRVAAFTADQLLDWMCGIEPLDDL